MIERQNRRISPSWIPTIDPEFWLVQPGVFEIFGRNINQAGKSDDDHWQASEPVLA